MSNDTRKVPDPVKRAAEAVWKKWSGEIEAATAASRREEFSFEAMHAPAEDWKTPEERMIDKIRQRMREYPEWYESDPDKLAATVGRELERIGALLSRALPYTVGAVEVWTIPLSVFNWTPRNTSVRGW